MVNVAFLYAIMRAFKSSGMAVVNVTFECICGGFGKKVGCTDLEISRNHDSGSVAEWLNAPVLKTGVEKSIVSSNLTGPAKKQRFSSFLWQFYIAKNSFLSDNLSLSKKFKKQQDTTHRVRN